MPEIRGSRRILQPERKVLRTIPEQIAEEIGTQIVSGVLTGGARLRETEIAQLFNVSRAPVREAIRILAQRGFVQFTPRQGAFVVDFTLEKVADLFDVTNVIVGLGARYAAVLSVRDVREHLEKLASGLSAMAEDAHCDPAEFSSDIWRTALYIGQHCGSAYIAALTNKQFHETAWSVVWRRGDRGFHSLSRRQDAAALNRRRVEAICAGDPEAAEAMSRELSRAARYETVTALAPQLNLTFDERRLGI